MISAIVCGGKSGSPEHAKRIASLFQMVGLSSLQPLRSCIYYLAGGLGSNIADSSPWRGICRGDPSRQSVFVVTKCASGSSSCCRPQRYWSNKAPIATAACTRLFIGRSHYYMCCAGERHFAHVDNALPAASRSAAQTGPSRTFAARVRVCFSYARVVICGYVKAMSSKAVATLAKFAGQIPRLAVPLSARGSNDGLCSAGYRSP